ncbi:MAG: zinc-ribbon domain-containing protein, partial [Deltaproteobacteria bacterium]|nr:zinc-ribbon domain-containing protein [Deltaproteobacteria bacterium]
MKFVCERCHTKYSIADEKVRGKVLKVRCKTCTNVITVRETGATIDDVASDAPRDPPIARAGSFDADAHGGDDDTMIAPRPGKGTIGKAGGLPTAALFAPGAPIAAPPSKRIAPAPPPEMDWYLAIDGAQTGPFSRSRLIDKIVAASKEADVHVWNADFDGWKPPKDAVELQAELARRRRTSTPVPPPPLRHPTGNVAVPLGASAAGGAVGIAPGRSSASMPVQSEAPAGKNAALALKKNGVASSAGAGKGIALGDLLGSDTGATPAPGAGLAAARASGALDPMAMLTPPPATAPAKVSGAPVAAATVGKRGPAKLLLGVLAVVLVLCGIVSIWMLRRPPVTVAVGEPAIPKAAGTDFAGMAERLAQEEANADKDKEKPAAAPVTAVVESKPVIARLEPPQKGGKGKAGRRKNQTTPPPLSPTSPSGSGLTAEQREAANRFG